MKRTIKNISIMDGTIKRIHFNKTRESVLLDFAGHNDMTVEFKNGRVKRADHVRKMKLNVGEHVIVSGSTNGESNSYMYGFDVQRNGLVYSGDYSLVKGTVQDIRELKNSCIMHVSGKNDKNLEIKFSKNIFSGHIKEGEVITCMCMRSVKDPCVSHCEKWGSQKCTGCTQGKKTFKYDALEITECVA